MKIKDLYIKAEEKLAHIQLGKFEIYDLLAFALKMERIDVLCSMDRGLTEEEIAHIQTLLEKRVAYKPLTKIMGYTYFYGKKFFVDENVLDPRPETEELIEWILNEQEYNSVLDLGVGSGCILLSLMKNGVEGVGVDISEKALNIARKNAKSLHLNPSLIQSNWFENLPAQKFDLIVSNPPYVDRKMEVGIETKYDPDLALYSDGAEHYEKIILNAKPFLNPKGALFFEVPREYYTEIENFALEANFKLLWKVCSAKNILFCKLF